MARSRSSSPPCAPARPTSSSSRSAPSACRSRSATRCASSALEDEVQPLRATQRRRTQLPRHRHREPAIDGALIRLAERAAKSTIPILIKGESGVGKEFIARAIHGGSERAGKPFVTVNCGAIPENLVESILFGHEKGTFTGATDKHLGKFEEANGGTLFLDEVGELPLDIQVKLLRALQEGEIDPVGAASRSRSTSASSRRPTAT